MVYILLGTGFEEMEAVAPADIMRRAGIEVQYVGIGGRFITGGNGITLQADITVEEMALEQMEMLVLPGGLGGVKSIGESAAAVGAIHYAYDNKKYIAAICAAPTLLGKLGLLAGVKAVCYPGMEKGMTGAHFAGDVKAVRDGTIITGQAPGAAMDFGLLLVEVLRGQAAEERVNGFIYYK